MVDFVFRLKTWHWFVILTTPTLFFYNAHIGKLMQTLWVLVFVGYLYLVVTVCYKRLKVPGLKYFNFCIIFIISATLIIIWGFGRYEINQDNYRQYGNLLWPLVVFTAYMISSLIYVIFFTAKVVVSVLENKQVGFEKYYRLGIAIWILPIGIWFLHPTVKLIYK